jgi:hypothetical protein
MIEQNNKIIELTNKPTIINVINTETMNMEKYYIHKGFYVFHYAEFKETDKNMEIYACLYDKLDFSELNINGRYRKILINKITKEATIFTNPDLENLDLEFPIKFDNKIVFREIENRRITGFVVCQELEIIRKISFLDKFICGEPSINYIDDIPYLFSLGFYDDQYKKGFLLIIDMETYDLIEIPINEALKIGFHSIFINQ